MSWSNYIKNLVKLHGSIQSYIFFIPVFLLVSIVLTVINTFSVFFIDRQIGRINVQTFDVAVTIWCYGVLESSMPLSSTMSDSLSASQLSSLSFGLSKSPFQSRKLVVSEMHSGALSLSHSAGWQPIRLIQWTFTTLVHSPGRYFGDNTGARSDVSDNENAVAPSCWYCDKNGFMISSVSVMYGMAVICLFWAQDSFCVEFRFWLPCHISKMSLTLAVLCNYFSSISLFISKSLSIFVVFNAGSSSANNRLLARANSFSTTVLRSVLPTDFDCLQLITSRRREKLASTPTPCGMIENISCAPVWEITLVWVRFLSLTPLVADIRYPKCTAKHPSVGVAIIIIRINLPPILC